MVSVAANDLQQEYDAKNTGLQASIWLTAEACSLSQIATEAPMLATRSQLRKCGSIWTEGYNSCVTVFTFTVIEFHILTQKSFFPGNEPRGKRSLFCCAFPFWPIDASAWPRWPHNTARHTCHKRRPGLFLLRQDPFRHDNIPAPAAASACPRSKNRNDHLP